MVSRGFTLIDPLLMFINLCGLDFKFLSIKNKTPQRRAIDPQIRIGIERKLPAGASDITNRNRMRLKK
jgi:hypothetical protein